MKWSARCARSVAVAAALWSLAAAGPARASRLKELVDIEGFRPNQLVGVGLVVGLAGTGDDVASLATRRPLATLMRHLGVVIDPLEIKSKNAALVMVTATLPPFGRPGMAVDVLVSSAGTARSLAGGTLLATTLRGADRQVYALAQGPLTVGGFDVEAGSGSAARKNHVTVGRIPGGGRVEREAPGGLPRAEVVMLLREPDFTTASRIAQAVNAALAPTSAGSATVRDPATVHVTPGSAYAGRMVEFIASLEAIEAVPDAPARVVVDERTGTIVVGANVTLSAAAVASGGISVNIEERPEVSQPSAFGAGETRVTPQSSVVVEEKGGRLRALRGASTVADVAAALNALGVKPRDLVSIFQALKTAGALHAEIQVM